MALDITKISNLSPVEVVKYCDLPVEVEDVFYRMVAETAYAKAGIEKADKHNEILAEQVYFARELLTEIMSIANAMPNSKVTRNIHRAIENSYFEL